MFRRYNQAAGPAHYQNSPNCEFRSNASILRPGIPKVPPEPPSKFEENFLAEISRETLCRFCKPAILRSTGGG